MPQNSQIELIRNTNNLIYLEIGIFSVALKKIRSNRPFKDCFFYKSVAVLK